MNMEQIEKKIEELLEILENDKIVLDLKKCKQKLLNNQDFLDKIKKLQQLDIYSDEYKNLKIELFKNPDFIEFKHLENEINLLILEINQKLKTLTNERSCHHENN